MYEVLFRKLNKNRIRYAVVGGIAVNLWGVPRMTADLDILVDLEKKNILHMVDLFVSLGFKPRLPVDPKELARPETLKKWREEIGMRVFTFFHPKDPLQIDVLTDSPLSYKNISPRIKRIPMKNFVIPLISKKDLIRMKEHAGRKQDKDDVESLKRLEEES